MFKSRLIHFFIAITFVTTSLDAKTEINIAINKNLELIAIIGGLTENGQDIWENYEPKTYALLGNRTKNQFLAYKNHRAVAIMQDLFENAIGISTLPFLALKFEPFPTNAIPKDLNTRMLRSFAPQGSDAEIWAALDTFRMAVNDFYEVSNFETWFQAHQPMYQKIIEEIKAAIPQDFVYTMEQFYGEKYLSYNLIPAVHFPPTMGFGPHIKEGDKKHIYNIFAPLGDQKMEEGKWKELGYNYPEKLLQMCLHEFGHSFVNPKVLNPENKAIYDTYDYLYEPIADAMYNQAYPNWESSLIEHIVRASEVRLLDRLGLQEMSNQYKNYHQKDRSFIYLPQILEQFQYYEQNRDSYPTFGSFVPTMLKALLPKEDLQNEENQPLKGRITNGVNNQAIEYATIGVVGTSIGVISEEQGRFSLDLKDAQPEDMLRIAYLGYEPYSIAIRDLDLKQELAITLFKKAIELPEIIVKDQLPTLIIGNQHKTRFFTGWGFDGVMRGASRGLLVEVENGPVRLQKFQSNIARMGFDSVLFRLRIFHMEANQPTKDVLPENIFIPVRRKGIIEHSFEGKNYWLEKGSYLIALEWIDTWGDGNGLLTIHMSKKGTLYYRNGAEDVWQISSKKGPAMYLEVNPLN